MENVDQMSSALKALLTQAIESNVTDIVVKFVDQGPTCVRFLPDSVSSDSWANMPEESLRLAFGMDEHESIVEAALNIVDTDVLCRVVCVPVADGKIYNIRVTNQARRGQSNDGDAMLAALMSNDLTPAPASVIAPFAFEPFAGNFVNTLEQIIARGSNCIDGRDFDRLVQFIPEEALADFGFELNDEFKGLHVAIPFTRENVLGQLEKDVAFGFEKLLDDRGMSALAMASVVGMWNWVLGEGLESYKGSVSGLFVETANKYGFTNPMKDA